MLAHRMMMAAAGVNVAIVPTDIAGLQLWVRSDLGITKDGSDLVSAWADQSGNGRDLTEGTNKPLWVNSLINGQPAIRFDGSNDRLDTSSFSVSQPITAFMVCKLVSSTNGDRILGPTIELVNRTGATVLIATAGQGDDVSGSITLGTSNFGLVKGVWNGSSSKISLNGGSDATSSINMTDAISAGIDLGHSGGALFANIEVAELAIYNSIISGANLTAFNAYISSRYGIF